MLTVALKLCFSSFNLSISQSILYTSVTSPTPWSLCATFYCSPYCSEVDYIIPDFQKDAGGQILYWCEKQCGYDLLLLCQLTAFNAFPPRWKWRSGGPVTACSSSLVVCQDTTCCDIWPRAINTHARSTDRPY